MSTIIHVARTSAVAHTTLPTTKRGSRRKDTKMASSPTNTPIQDLHPTSIIEDIRTLYVHPHPDGTFVEQTKKKTQKAAEQFVLYEEMKELQEDIRHCVRTYPTDHWRKCRDLVFKWHRINEVHQADKVNPANKRY